MNMYCTRGLRRDLDRFVGENVWVAVTVIDDTIKWWVRLFDINQSEYTGEYYYTCFGIPDSYVHCESARKSATEKIVKFWYKDLKLIQPVEVRTYSELFEEE